MTAPTPAAAPELSAAMAETRAMREALAAEIARLEAEAVKAEEARDASRNGTERMLYRDRADRGRAQAARLRAITGPGAVATQEPRDIRPREGERNFFDVTCGACGGEFGTNFRAEEIACPHCEARRCPHCSGWFGGES